MKKINLGSGPLCLPDWDNIDNSFNAKLSKHPLLKNTLHSLKILPDQYYKNPWPTYILTLDIRNPLPFPSNSVDYIYTSHTLEHVEHYESKQILQECYRILKPQGIIRIVLPDLEKMMKEYLSSPNINTFLNRFYGYERSTQTKKDNPLLKRLKHSPHQWMYTFPSLQELLQSIHFKDIKELTYATGECVDIKLLDKEEPTNLYVEAKK
jgi:SAM-dependent methyltransferase